MNKQHKELLERTQKRIEEHRAPDTGLVANAENIGEILAASRNPFLKYYQKIGYYPHGEHWFYGEHETNPLHELLTFFGFKYYTTTSRATVRRPGILVAADVALTFHYILATDPSSSPSLLTARVEVGPAWYTRLEKKRECIAAPQDTKRTSETLAQTTT